LVELDNASYHNVKTEDTVCPNFSQKKCCSPKLSYTTQQSFFCYWYQKVLYEKNKTKKTPVVYKTDKIATLHGHCELKPIELIWAQVKGFVAKNNATFRLKDVKELTYALSENLQKTCGRKQKNMWSKLKKNTGKKTI
jgi:hypothetical protein